MTGAGCGRLGEQSEEVVPFGPRPAVIPESSEPVYFLASSGPEDFVPPEPSIDGATAVSTRWRTLASTGQIISFAEADNGGFCLGLTNLSDTGQVASMSCQSGPSDDLMVVVGDAVVAIANLPESASVAHAVQVDQYQEVQWPAVAFPVDEPGTQTVIFYDLAGNEVATVGGD